MTTPPAARRPAPRRALDRRGLTLFLERTAGVLRVGDLTRFGVGTQAIRRRVGPGGRWRMPYPGVLVASRHPTRHQRLTAAVLYAGPGAMVTGLDALWLAGLGCLDELAHLGPLHRADGAARGGPAGSGSGTRPVLLAPGRRRARLPALEIEGGSDLPRPCRSGRLPYAPPARAAIDAVRRTSNPDVARLLLAMVLREGLCDRHELTGELRPGAPARDRLARQVLEELAWGLTRAAIARLKALFARHEVDPPHWDAPVQAARRTVAFPHAVWLRSGVALWIGARDTDPADERRRRSLLSRGIAGLIVLTVEPSEVFDTPEQVLARVREALSSAATRRAPALSLASHPPSTQTVQRAGTSESTESTATTPAQADPPVAVTNPPPANPPVTATTPTPTNPPARPAPADSPVAATTRAPADPSVTVNNPPRAAA